MISIIVISESRSFRESIQEELRGTQYKVSYHSTLREAHPLLASGIFDFCILDAGARLRDWMEGGAAGKSGGGNYIFIAVAEAASSEEVDHAYRAGCDYVFPKPLPGGLLKTVLSRPNQPDYPMPPNQPTPIVSGKSSPGSPNLDIIRDFSRILSHTLDLPSLVHHFVLKVREIIGVNRVAIFLEDSKNASPSTRRTAHHRLKCICSIGIPADVQNCLELSKENGVGQWVTETGQILRAEQAGALLAPAQSGRVQQEFGVLGCQIAIPIADRERTIGVAMLGGHITRTGFTDEELQLMFHLMEELGLSVKNNWLHSELAANHKLFADVLASMKSGSLVVGPELEVIHANPAMIAFVGDRANAERPLTFAELPAEIGGRIHEVVENGRSVDPFYVTSGPEGEKTFRVSVIPFQNPSRRLPQSAMVVMEDFTQVENAKKVAVQAASAKLTSLIAKRFAHEIRNSLVPLTTHLQLMDDRYGQAEFQSSLKEALENETTRISRFTEQMLFLAEARPQPSVITSVEKLLRESFAKAQSALRLEGILIIHAEANVSRVRCHPQGLMHAFQEVFINGLQSSGSPQITVTIEPAPDRWGKSFIRVGFRDNGPGFDEETAQKATEPFYTSRNTGIGLGLTIASKVALDHGGWIDIRPRSSGDEPDVLMYFPTDDNHD